MLAVATTNVTMLSSRPASQSPGAEDNGQSLRSETQVWTLTPLPTQPARQPVPSACFKTFLSGMAAHLTPAGQALCHTLGSHQALVEMKVPEPTSLCTRGGWTERSCHSRGQVTYEAQRVCWSEGALLKGGDSGIQRWLQPGDRRRLRVNEGSGGPTFSPTLTPPSGLGPSVSLWGPSCPDSGFRCIWWADP